MKVLAYYLVLTAMVVSLNYQDKTKILIQSSGGDFPAVVTGIQGTNVLDQMVIPNVEHRVIRTCPAGYEGHFVDEQPGFEASWGSELTFGMSGVTATTPTISIMGSYSYGPPAYTICFKKEFMDKVRKNPEMRTYRPAPPRGV